jgi:hypothetical protein
MKNILKVLMVIVAVMFFGSTLHAGLTPVQEKRLNELKAQNLSPAQAAERDRELLRQIAEKKAALGKKSTVVAPLAAPKKEVTQEAVKKVAAPVVPVQAHVIKIVNKAPYHLMYIRQEVRNDDFQLFESVKDGTRYEFTANVALGADYIRLEVEIDGKRVKKTFDFKYRKVGEQLVWHMPTYEEWDGQTGGEN